ncbi:MAG: methyltransferase domain-containing protein [Porticoccaceae bacterium]
MLDKLLQKANKKGMEEEFSLNGFLVYRNLLKKDEVDGLRDHLKNKYLGDKEKALFNDLANNIPELIEYIADERVLGFVQKAIGHKAKFLQCSDLHFNHNVYGWHRDSASRDYGGVDWDSTLGKYTCIKVIVYLECSNFGLAVVPGSHKYPIPQEELKQQEKKPIFIKERESSRLFSFDTKNWRVVIPLMEPGDAIVFDERLFHKGYPLVDLSSERKNYLKQLGISKFAENKTTFCFTYGRENMHSDRFYSNFRFHRAELKYKDLAAEVVNFLREKGLLLNSYGRNSIIEHPKLGVDLYKSKKTSESKEEMKGEKKESFEINPSQVSSHVKDEYSSRGTTEMLPAQCPSCKSRNKLYTINYPDRRQWYFVNLAVFSCVECGLSWVPNKPFGLSEYYEKSYSKTKGRQSSVNAEVLFSDETFLKSMGFGRSKRHVKTLSKYNSKIGTIVDFGCGFGLTLSLVEAESKYGVEVDPEVAKYAATRGIKIVSNTKELPDGVADVILSSHSLEHIPMNDVTDSLQEFLRVLKPEGIGLIEVPNVPLLRLNTTKVRHAPHLNFFTNESLKNILISSGFEILDQFGAGKEERPLRRKQFYCPQDIEDDVRVGALVAIVRKNSM